jgi:AAT family amino acid transporter
MAHLEHKLKNRHLQMIVLGGMVGTGLFFGSGKAIVTTGPSIILAYLLGGFVMYIIVRALGEMTVYAPSSGSFSDYAHKYLGKYAGFIAGWSAWFQYTVVSMLEITASAVFLDYFIPTIPHWISCLIILIIFALINLISVKSFGEFEFWFAGIKIVTIIFMILFSIYLILFHHVINHNITDYMRPDVFFSQGYNGFFVALVIVFFSFGGIEFVSIAAAETENPAVNVPVAIRGIIVRILLFYVLTMLVILIMYPYQQISAQISPFVDVFSKIGFPAAAGVMAVVALTAALSSFNSCIYAASRMLFNLGQNGHAPKLFAKINSKNNLPSNAIIGTAIIILLTVLINYIWQQAAIIYLLAVVTLSVLIVWFMIIITHLRFRYNINSNKQQLTYKLWLFPYANIFAGIVLIFIVYQMSNMQDMRDSIIIAPLWLAILSVIYFFNYLIGKLGITNDK